MGRVLPLLVAWTSLKLDNQRGGASAPAGLPNGRRLAVGGGAADVTWRLAAQVAGPGGFLAGDAALALDPASSHGVLRALMSGILTAHHCIQICRDGAAEEMAAAAYGRWMREWFDHDAEKLAGFYGKLENPPQWLTSHRRHV